MWRKKLFFSLTFFFFLCSSFVFLFFFFLEKFFIFCVTEKLVFNFYGYICWIEEKNCCVWFRNGVLPFVWCNYTINIVFWGFKCTLECNPCFFVSVFFIFSWYYLNIDFSFLVHYKYVRMVDLALKLMYEPDQLCLLVR